MPDAQRFPFTTFDSSLGAGGLLPFLPITLLHRENTTTVLGLLDSGASVNVLPFNLGIQLGAIWNDELATLKLTGNLANFQACPLIVSAVVGQFSPVRLAFAWTKAEEIPLILGQVNFFMEFNVCFYRTQQSFEVRPSD